MKTKLHLLLAAAALSSAASAQAADYTITSGTARTAGVYLPGDNVTINMTSGYFGSSDTNDQNFANANVIITNMQFNNGYSGMVTSFDTTTTVTGSGLIAQTATAGNAQDLLFSGNMQGFSGAIRWTDRNATGSALNAVGSGTNNVVQFGGTMANPSIATVAQGTVTTDGSGNWINNVAGTGAIGDGTSAVNNVVFNYATSGTYNYVVATNAINARYGVYFLGGADLTATGVISGGTLLRKEGAGTVTLSGANTYTGVTTIASGTLKAGSATAFGSGAITVTGGTLDLGGYTIANAVTLNSGSLALGTGGSVTLAAPATVSGTLSGSGSITGNVTVNGTLAVGNSPGLISVTGDTTLSSATTSIFELGGLTRGTEYDALNVSGLLTLDGTLSVVTWNGFDTTTLTAGTSFDLLDWGTLNATGFDVATDLNLSSLTLAGGLAWDTSAFLTDGTIAVTAVPEPSTYGLLGAGALAAVAFVRRRRKFAGKAA